MDMTHHALVRSQQRGISTKLIELVLEFGAEERAGTGVSKFFLDKAGRKALKAYAADKVSQCANLYVVLADESLVITVGHRYQRIRRH